MRIVLVLPVVALLPFAARADELKLSRVVLSSGGVGYVEYQAQVDGPASLSLDVPLAQVNDVLTSLVVLDPAGGVGGIELPGRDGGEAPAGNVLGGAGSLGSALSYLNSLQGVALTVTGPQPMAGRLMHAEAMRVAMPPGAPADVGTRTRVTLLTETGLRQFVLEDAESVQVADPALRDRIAAALASLRRNTDLSTRRITLREPGTGARTVTVGYVAAMALWKASYRLVLPSADGGKARLQAWAVLENGTGADWNGVRLALQYGSPVALQQDIYRSYLVTRPSVPVALPAGVLPDQDRRSEPMVARVAPSGSFAAAPAPALPALAKALAPPMAAPAAAATADEGGQDTVFTLPDPVVLAAGHTASVPFLDRSLAAERIGLVQEDRPHPLATIRLTNDTGSSLPPGLLTLYDPASPADFAGDARMGGLPPGETRLLAFAEDLRTLVTWHSESGTQLAGLTAANGVMKLDQRARWTATIDLVAPPAEARRLLVEIPKANGTILTADDGTQANEETATAWRLPVTLAAGAARHLVVHVDRVEQQSVALLDDGDDVLATLLSGSEITAPQRVALSRIATLQRDVAAREDVLEQLKTQGAAIDTDEDRIRRNLAAVPGNDALHQQLVRALAADEAKLSQLATDNTAAKGAVAAARAALSAAVQTLLL